MPEPQIETEQNKGVVRRFIEEVQNHKDWDAYDELNAPDFVNLSRRCGQHADRKECGRDCNHRRQLNSSR